MSNKPQLDEFRYIKPYNTIYKPQWLSQRQVNNRVTESRQKVGRKERFKKIDKTS